jgi:hypothetical protein
MVAVRSDACEWGWAALLTQVLDKVSVISGALAIDGAHELPFIAAAGLQLSDGLFAEDGGLFPPFCVLFEKFENAFG